MKKRVMIDALTQSNCQKDVAATWHEANMQRCHISQAYGSYKLREQVRYIHQIKLIIICTGDQVNTKTLVIDGRRMAWPKGCQSFPT
jgi:predicted transposase YbfD/YdcC